MKGEGTILYYFCDNKHLLRTNSLFVTVPQAYKLTKVIIMIRIGGKQCHQFKKNVEMGHGVFQFFFNEDVKQASFKK